MAVPLLDGLHAQDLLSGLGQLAFFSVIYGFVTDQVAQFCVGLLVRMTAWGNGTALLLTTLWLIWQGYGLITGQDRTPATVRVTEAVRACVVVSVAGGLSLGGIPLFLWLGDGLLDAVTTIVTADPTPVAQRIDRSLATMQLVLASVEAIDTASSVDLHTDRDRAQWLVGAGIAGPAVVGGALLIMYRVGLALFVGFGPLFVLCLLFKPTRSLFWRWAEYGVGTMFAFATLGVMVSLATRIVGAVAVALWAGHLAGTPDAGITSRAIQQGGVGLLMTTLIIAVPPMAAAFFRGVLGQFMAQSVFGGREQPSVRAQPVKVEPASVPHSRLMAQSDEVRRQPKFEGSGAFLERYPEAVASHGWSPASQRKGYDPASPAPSAPYDGYLRDPGIIQRPISALERGPLTGPHAIVLHRTVSTTAESSLVSFERGVGTHFVIDKDGTVYQTASLDQKTSHVGPIRSRCLAEGTCQADEEAKIKNYGPKQGHDHEKKKAYPDRYPMNEDSIGIEVVGMYWEESQQWDAPTPEQQQAIKKLIGTLQDRYSLTDSDVYEHDKISRKTAGEGAGLYDGADRLPTSFPPTTI